MSGNVISGNTAYMHEESLKRTPLYESHVRLGGKIVPFAGWEMPVQYSGLMPEHRAVREKCGIFDVSHMGEILVHGSEAEAALNYLTSNDVRKLSDGKAQYSCIPNERGGIVDDIIVYRFSTEKYLLCVNASNSDADFAWLNSHNKHKAVFEDHSSSYGQVALQGPFSSSILSSLINRTVLDGLKSFHFVEETLLGIPVIIARTGYTGEDGFEIFTPWNDTEALWNALLEKGASAGLIPAGLGARDTLRLEACYPLHGHELSQDISAMESGLGWVVKFDKGAFMGRDVLFSHNSNGPPRSLIGFFVEEAGIARHGDKIYAASGEEIGVVTSGTKTPTLDKALGLGLIDSRYSEIGKEIFTEVRGRKIKCKVVKRPFYKRGR